MCGLRNMVDIEAEGLLVAAVDIGLLIIIFENFDFFFEKLFF